jgi:hypothetical protein
MGSGRKIITNGKNSKAVAVSTANAATQVIAPITDIGMLVPVRPQRKFLRIREFRHRHARTHVIPSKSQAIEL